MLGEGDLGTKIDDIRAVNLITAQDTWLEAVPQALAEFVDSRLDGQREIKRRYPFRVEPGAVDGGAVAR